MYSIELKNIKKIFGSQTILNGITATFNQNQTYALMGASGQGKSTLLHILAGFDCPSSGSITLHHNQKKIPFNINPTFITFMTQAPFFISELTVLENCLLPARIYGLSEKESVHHAYKLLQAVHLENVAQWNVGQLSGGQKQRIALVRSLITQPKFLLADEPTGSLDEHNAQEILNLLLFCKKTWGMGLIISSHSKHSAQHMNIVFTLENGILMRT